MFKPPPQLANTLQCLVKAFAERAPAGIWGQGSDVKARALESSCFLSLAQAGEGEKSGPGSSEHASLPSLLAKGDRFQGLAHLVEKHKCTKKKTMGRPKLWVPSHGIWGHKCLQATLLDLNLLPLRTQKPRSVGRLEGARVWVWALFLVRWWPPSLCRLWQRERERERLLHLLRRALIPR